MSFGGNGAFTKIEDEYGEVTGFGFEGDLPDEDEYRQVVAIAFDSRYDYDDIGRSIEAVWLEGQTAMELEEAGIIRLVGAGDDVPQPVEVEGRSIFLYTIESA